MYYLRVMGIRVLTSGSRQSCVPRGGGGKSISMPFSAFRDCPSSWAPGPPPPSKPIMASLQPQWPISFSDSAASPSLSKGPCDCVGPTWVIQDNFLSHLQSPTHGFWVQDTKICGVHYCAWQKLQGKPWLYLWVESRDFRSKSTLYHSF